MKGEVMVLRAITSPWPKGRVCGPQRDNFAIGKMFILGPKFIFFNSAHITKSSSKRRREREKEEKEERKVFNFIATNLLNPLGEFFVKISIIKTSSLFFFLRGSQEGKRKMEEERWKKKDLKKKDGKERAAVILDTKSLLSSNLFHKVFVVY